MAKLSKTSVNEIIVLCLLLVFSLILGCAPKKAIHPLALSLSAEEIIQKLQQEYPQVRTLQAWGKIKWKDTHQEGSADNAILLQRPETLRVEGLTFLGQSVYTLVIRDGEINLFVPSDKRVYRGPASPVNMERFFSLPFNAEDALSVLCGRVPLCPNTGATVLRDGDMIVLELPCELNGWYQRIILDPSHLDPVGFYLEDTAGQSILSVKWSDYRTFDETRVPSKIEVEMPLKGNHLRVRLLEMELDIPIQEKRFQLELPPETQVQPI